MSNVVTLDKSKVPAKLAAAFGGVESNDDLTDGVSGGYGVISIKSSKWRIKYNKEETLVTNEDGDPVPTLQVVLLKANPHVSKNYYAKGFTDDSAAAPDCYSVDGKRPDPSIEDPVSTNCQTCPKGVFGSRITEAGKKAKACADSRRVAVVPANDITNELFGGPMLLRIPATSLSDLMQYGKLLKEKGFPYQSVVTKLGFDPEASYPKLTFKAVRPLSDEEADQVIAQLGNPNIDSILAEPQDIKLPEEATAPATSTVDVNFEEESSSASAAPAKKKASKKAKAKAKPKPAPIAAEPEIVEEEEEEATSGSDSLDDELDGILSALD